MNDFAPGTRGHRRPAAVVFDVNETLSDMSVLAGRFEEMGAPAHLARTWFAQLLRDGFALTAAASSRPFSVIGAESLRLLLHGVPLDRSSADAVAHVMGGFDALTVHADVDSGTLALADLGIRLITFSNGSADVAAALLDRAGIRQRFELLLSVEDTDLWKPAAGAYTYAVQRCGVTPDEAMLVAVHPWDIDGAGRAGLATAWINRDDSPYPAYFRPADVEARSITHLAALLG